jgi:hypothetical protein
MGEQLHTAHLKSGVGGHLAGQALEIGDEGMRQAGSLVGGRATRPAPAVICNLATGGSRNDGRFESAQASGVPAGHI